MAELDKDALATWLATTGIVNVARDELRTGFEDHISRCSADTTIDALQHVVDHMTLNSNMTQDLSRKLLIAVFLKLADHGVAFPKELYVNGQPAAKRTKVSKKEDSK